MASSLTSVRVNLPAGAYEIAVRPGLLADAGELLAPLIRSRKACIVTNNRVGPLHLRALQESLQRGGFQTIVATIPDGEQYKMLDRIAPIYDTFLAERVERATPVIALGGGVVGDMSGFVAATMLRGVPFIQIPTSLLAMVDASVGGKTGINHAAGKNLIGAFHQPVAVLIDPSVLKTLPERELRGGLAECIKHDCIRDAAGFAHLEQNIHRALELDIDYLAELVAHNVAIKARVVEADPLEKGERAHLNFGHTFGHAIELVSRFEYSHGEAVALGMVACAHLCVHLGLIDEASRRRIVAVIEKAGLPTGKMRLETAEIVDAMAFDKKVRSGKVRFVLLDRIGHAIMREDIPPDLINNAVESLRE